MRLSLLALPLICLAACNSEAPRASASASTPAAPATPASAPSAPTVSTPAVATPAPAPVAAAPAAKPTPSPVSSDLTKFVGPTENAELFGYDDGNSRIFLYSGGTVVVPIRLAADGDYEIVVNAACDEAAGQKAKFNVAVDGNQVGDEVTCTTTDPKEYVVKASGLKAGEHKIGITFLNDLYKEGEYDLNFFVHGVTLKPAK